MGSLEEAFEGEVGFETVGGVEGGFGGEFGGARPVD